MPRARRPRTRAASDHTRKKPDATALLPACTTPTRCRSRGSRLQLAPGRWRPRRHGRRQAEGDEDVGRRRAGASPGPGRRTQALVQNPMARSVSIGWTGWPSHSPWRASRTSPGGSVVHQGARRVDCAVELSRPSRTVGGRMRGAGASVTPASYPVKAVLVFTRRGSPAVRWSGARSPPPPMRAETRIPRGRRRPVGQPEAQVAQEQHEQPGGREGGDQEHGQPDDECTNHWRIPLVTAPSVAHGRPRLRDPFPRPIRQTTRGPGTSPCRRGRAGPRPR